MDGLTETVAQDGGSQGQVPAEAGETAPVAPETEDLSEVPAEAGETEEGAEEEEQPLTESERQQYENAQRLLGEQGRELGELKQFREEKLRRDQQTLQGEIQAAEIKITTGALTAGEQLMKDAIARGVPPEEAQRQGLAHAFQQIVRFEMNRQSYVTELETQGIRQNLQHVAKTTPAFKGQERYLTEAEKFLVKNPQYAQDAEGYRYAIFRAIENGQRGLGPGKSPKGGFQNRHKSDARGKGGQVSEREREALKDFVGDDEEVFKGALSRIERDRERRNR